MAGRFFAWYPRSNVDSGDVKIFRVRNTGLFPPLPVRARPILRNTPVSVFIPAVYIL